MKSIINGALRAMATVMVRAMCAERVAEATRTSTHGIVVKSGAVAMRPTIGVTHNLRNNNSSTCSPVGHTTEASEGTQTAAARSGQHGQTRTSRAMAMS